jgi:hypothetical protein
VLQITVPISPEGWDEKREEFVEAKYKTLQLEHSLVSVRKWESKWCKPFLGKQTKTNEELLDYIKCMTLTQNVDPEIYTYLSHENIRDIETYINAPMTATVFSDDKQGRASREIVTAEVIYYWMIALQIPVEFQKWHLNSLLTLIRVCNITNSPGKKMSSSEIMRRNAALNAARRKQLNSKG